MVKSEPASDTKRPKFIKPVKVLVVATTRTLTGLINFGRFVSLAGSDFTIISTPIFSLYR